MTVVYFLLFIYWTGFSSLHGQTSAANQTNTVNWGLPTNLKQYTMMTSAFVSNYSFGNMIAQYDTLITSACGEMTSANSDFHPHNYLISCTWRQQAQSADARNIPGEEARAKFESKIIFRIFTDSDWSFLQLTWNFWAQIHGNSKIEDIHDSFIIESITSS